MSYFDIEYIKLRVKLDDLKALSAAEGEETYNENVIMAFANDAAARVDEALDQAGYITPVSEPTDYLKALVFDLFLYRLYNRHYDNEEMKDVYVRYNAAHSTILKIAKREISVKNIARKSETIVRAIAADEPNTVFSAELLRALP